MHLFKFIDVYMLEFADRNRGNVDLFQVVYLLTYEDEKCSLTETIDKYSTGVPPVQWLPWIPQLLTSLVRIEGKLILNLISQVRLQIVK